MFTGSTRGAGCNAAAANAQRQNRDSVRFLLNYDEEKESSKQPCDYAMAATSAAAEFTPSHAPLTTAEIGTALTLEGQRRLAELRGAADVHNVAASKGRAPGAGVTAYLDDSSCDDCEVVASRAAAPPHTKRAFGETIENTSEMREREPSPADSCSGGMVARLAHRAAAAAARVSTQSSDCTRSRSRGVAGTSAPQFVQSSRAGARPAPHRKASAPSIARLNTLPATVSQDSSQTRCRSAGRGAFPARSFGAGSPFPRSTSPVRRQASASPSRTPRSTYAGSYTRRAVGIERPVRRACTDETTSTIPSPVNVAVPGQPPKGAPGSHMITTPSPPLGQGSLDAEAPNAQVSRRTGRTESPSPPLERGGLAAHALKVAATSVSRNKQTSPPGSTSAFGSAAPRSASPVIAARSQPTAAHRIQKEHATLSNSAGRQAPMKEDNADARRSGACSRARSCARDGPRRDTIDSCGTTGAPPSVTATPRTATGPSRPATAETRTATCKTTPGAASPKPCPPSRGGARCRCGHAMVPCSTSAPWVCDGCERAFQAGERYSGRRHCNAGCDFDFCARCAAGSGEAGVPPGYRCLPDSERLFVLDGLQRRRAELDRVLARHAAFGAYEGGLSRDHSLDGDLSRVERSIEQFSKPRVLVKC